MAINVEDLLIEWPDEVLTEGGQLRCQVALGSFGRGQCPNPSTHIAVTTMSSLLHLVARVCDDHAPIVAGIPGWGVRLG